MATDPFNSAGGYTTGIPPIQVIDDKGSVYTANLVVGDMRIYGDSVSYGNVYANNFQGTFVGDIVGSIIAPGNIGEVIFNGSDGNIKSDAGFTYNESTNSITIDGAMWANVSILGSRSTPVVTTQVLTATTNSNAPDQQLISTPGASIASVDYTVIATNRTANTRQTSKLFASVLGDEVGYFEYGTIDVPSVSPGVADFKVTYNAGNVVLTTSPLSTNQIDYRVVITLYNDSV